MNLLPLETFRELMGFHPLHFWQLSSPTVAPLDTGCEDLLFTQPWQNADAVGRTEIAAAITRAEAMLRQHLGYSVAPIYDTVTVAWPRYYDGSMDASGPAGSDGRWLTVQLPVGFGHVQAAGTEQLTLISAPSIVMSDADGDGYAETWSASAATSVTDPAAIAVYVSVSYRFGDTTVGERWRILPVAVAISGGVVTVGGSPGSVGGAWQLVRPLRYAGLVPQALDPNDAAVMMASVDIYQRTTATGGSTAATSQGVIAWETAPAHGWWCCCADCATTSAYGGSPDDPAATAQAVARVGIRDAANGIVFAAQASYDATAQTWAALDWAVCSVPDRLTVRTLSGLPLASDGQMSPVWRPIVARLAAAELARPICACERISRELARWQFDLARTGGSADELYGAISPGDLDNPLGTRRGHVAAWRAIVQHRQARGFLP